MEANELFRHPMILPVSDRHYRLGMEYTYQWENYDYQFKLTVPSGFIYDGASVPQWAWTVSGIRPDGLIRAAALLHDWVYINKGLMPPGSWQYESEGHWLECEGRWSRLDADRLFARVMREAGVNKVKRRLAYQAVRIAGWYYWGTYG